MNMASTLIHFRADEQIKTQASEILANLGMDMTTGLNIFLRTLVKEGGIPFRVTTEPEPPVNKEFAAYIRRALTEADTMAKDPNTRWYSQEEVDEMLGLNDEL
jgi:DNA-damage-inducible protein J